MVEFEHFKSEAGLHTFVLSVSEWMEKTESIALLVKRGKYGETYAHKDMAFPGVNEKENDNIQGLGRTVCGG